MNSGSEVSLAGALAMGPLRPSFPVWGLFGRSLLYLVGQILIVPAPWTATGYYRFLCEQVALPDGRRLRFLGQPGDIWYVFIALAVLGWLHNTRHPGVTATVILVTALLTVPVIRWFCANIRTEDGKLQTSFNGETLAYLGWSILFVVSLVTIIGWAWVIKATMHWLCRSIDGTIGFTFTASGSAILGRTVLLILLCALILPIPWALRWYANWFASQFSVVAPSAGG